MEHSEFETLVDGLFKQAKDLLSTKTQDYDKSGDRLSIFKVVSACFISLTGKILKLWEVALVLVLLKLGRYTNLRSGGKKPKHEAIKDTVVDDVNYIVLMEACAIEEDKGG